MTYLPLTFVGVTLPHPVYEFVFNELKKKIRLRLCHTFKWSLDFSFGLSESVEVTIQLLQPYTEK